MSINSYDELLAYAGSKKTDIEKLQVLQQYFIENVSFYYPEEIAQDIALHKDKYNDYKRVFSSLDEKNDEVDEFEKKYGENFHFSKTIRNKIVGLLGEVTEPITKTVSLGIINIPGYNGSIIDVFRRIGRSEPKYANGLIIEGVCRNFSDFAKIFCNHFNIESSIFECFDHVFNVVSIDGELRVFDFTRMIGIRDGYLNPNNQQINDWFNMSFDKMFEYKPDRIIDKINGQQINPPITIQNYNEFVQTKNNYSIRH